MNLIALFSVAAVADELCQNFIPVCISLLRNAHVSHKVEGGKHILQLAEPYNILWESVSELWFLGMQAMCAVAPLYPAVTDTILKSAWLPAAIKMLNTVSGMCVLKIVYHNNDLIR